jgi:ADP-heptose:LPS heptosyltransferase
MALVVRTDCRFFIGDRPCEWGGICEGCSHYAPAGTRVLVIKLAAAGDVLRTTSILPPLKRKYAESCVTWVTDGPALPLLSLNPHIDRLLPFCFDTWLELSGQTFDVLICLDKERRAAAMSASIDAKAKFGFGLSEEGAVVTLNEAARYDYELGLSNEMKFRENTATFPEIFCRTAELEYAGEPYELVLPESSVEHASDFLGTLDLADPVVGLNVGAGHVFANKAWTVDGYAWLARAIRDRLGGTAVALGGPEDRDRSAEVLRLSDGAAVDGGVHSVLDFAAIVGMLDAVVTGDTLALHIAVALGVPAVVLFGPTVPQEIDLYGNGAKLVTAMHCAPCYSRTCEVSPNCMEAIDPEDVFTSLREVLGL